MKGTGTGGSRTAHGRPRWDLVVLTLGSQTMVILPGPDMPEEARQRLYGIVTELRPAA